MDPQELEKLLQYLLDLMPINQGQAPPGAAPMSDPTSGSAGTLPPSDLNEWITTLTGSSGPPMGPLTPAPNDQRLAELGPMQMGPPPGPEQVMGPEGSGGIGVNDPEVMAPQYLRPPQEQLPPEHPEATLDFLRQLLGNRPELLDVQTPANPTRTQNSQMMAAAIEFINEQLQGQGQAPIESADRGAGGLRGFSERSGKSPQHVQNIMAQARRRAQGQVEGLPRQVQEMLAPDAAARIAENPAGRLTPRASDLLSERGSMQGGDPTGLAQLRTDQLDMLLGAGPERGSLVDPQMLGSGEAALARQMGGIQPFVASGGAARDVQGTTPDPAQRDAFIQFLLGKAEGEGNQALEQMAPGMSGVMYPEAGMDPTAQRITQNALEGSFPPERTRPYIGGHGTSPDVSGAKMPADVIGSANRDIFAALTSQIPHDWEPRAGETARMPTAGMPEGRPGLPGLDFIDELRQMIAAQRSPGSPAAERVQFPGEAPTNRLEQDVAQMEGAPEQIGPGPDMLESQAGPVTGLDASGNIRAGGPGGQVISGSLLEQLMGIISGSMQSRPLDLGPMPQGGMREGDLPKMPWQLGGMREPELGPLPPGGFQQELGLGPQAPGGFQQELGLGPMPGPGMTPMPGFGPAPGMGITSEIPDFLRELLGVGRR